MSATGVQSRACSDLRPDQASASPRASCNEGPSHRCFAATAALQPARSSRSNLAPRSAAAIGRLARRWRCQHRWTREQLASLVNLAAWGEEASPHASLPVAPPMGYCDVSGVPFSPGAFSDGTSSDGPVVFDGSRSDGPPSTTDPHSARAALQSVPNAGVVLQRIQNAGVARALTLEFRIRCELVAQITSAHGIHAGVQTD